MNRNDSQRMMLALILIFVITIGISAMKPFARGYNTNPTPANSHCYTPNDTWTMSSSRVMMGFKIRYTSLSSGRVEFFISAIASNTVAGAGGSLGFAIGQGPPPDWNTPQVGREIIGQKIFDVAYPNQRIPISFTDLTGMYPGKTYWVDGTWNVAVNSRGEGGNFTLSNITACIYELPLA
jgi:hypothetical protein